MIGAAATDKHHLWMPYLDEGMLNEELVKELFGSKATSQKLRRLISESSACIRSKVCIVCTEMSA